MYDPEMLQDNGSSITSNFFPGKFCRMKNNMLAMKSLHLPYMTIRNH
jgi:hypothetical protein